MGNGKNMNPSKYIENKFNDFIVKNTTEKDWCKFYKDYPYPVQRMLKNLYKCCFRFNMYNQQIVYVLNQALEPFVEDSEEKDLFDL